MKYSNDQPNHEQVIIRKGPINDKAGKHISWTILFFLASLMFMFFGYIYSSPTNASEPAGAASIPTLERDLQIFAEALNPKTPKRLSPNVLLVAVLADKLDLVYVVSLKFSREEMLAVDDMKELLYMKTLVCGGSVNMALFNIKNGNIRVGIVLLDKTGNRVSARLFSRKECIDFLDARDLKNSI